MIIPFPVEPATPISVTLTGAEWFALMLKLTSRATGADLATANAAEAKILQQLEKAS